MEYEDSVSDDAGPTNEQGRKLHFAFCEGLFAGLLRVVLGSGGLPHILLTATVVVLRTGVLGVPVQPQGAPSRHYTPYSVLVEPVQDPRHQWMSSPA